jgi:hypothetical protein
MLSSAQQGRYRPLVAKAWDKAAGREGWSLFDRAARDAWYRKQLVEVLGIYTTKQADQKRDFETLMAHFEAICGDSLYWQLRLATGNKRRVLYHLRRMLLRIGADDAYLQAIADQMALGDVEALEPVDLRQLLIALDVHVKRHDAAYAAGAAAHRRAG